MTPAVRPNRTHNRALVSGGVVVLALTAVAFFLGSHAPAREPVAEEPAPVVLPPAPSPSPSAEPEAAPPAVEGTLEVADVIDLSAAGTGLHQDGAAENAPVPVDEQALDAFAEELRVLLDGALTDVHTEGEAAALAGGLAGPADVLALGDPDNPIVEARYRVVVAARGVPEWAEIDVAVTREDGSVGAAVLAVLPGSPPALVGVAPTPAPPAGAPEAGR